MYFVINRSKAIKMTLKDNINKIELSFLIKMEKS